MSETAQKVISGDIRAAARLISNIDNGLTGSGISSGALSTYRECYVIGITGAPASGKAPLLTD